MARKSALFTPETTLQGVPDSGPKMSLFAPLVQNPGGPPGAAGARVSVLGPLPEGSLFAMIRFPSLVLASVLARVRATCQCRRPRKMHCDSSL